MKEKTALTYLSNTVADNIKTESGFSGSRKFVVVGFCQHDDELPRSIEGAELFGKLNDHERVQNNSAVHCYIKPCKNNYNITFVN